MNSVSARRARFVVATASLAAATLILTGCSGGKSGGSSDSGSAAKSITVGTTDTITSLDPAGSYDNGSLSVQVNVFPLLFDSPYGSPDVKPDIAESGSFVDPNTFEVKLKPGLKFSNGHDLTASDVKFTFDRQQAIGKSGADGGNGPSSLLANLDTTTVKDDSTVDFHLKVPNDQTFEQVLSSEAGFIVDEQVFSPTKLTPDNDIVKADAFAGQYKITSYKVNQLIEYKKYSGYKGLLAPAKTDTIIAKYYKDASNLKLDVQSGNIDAAYRSLSAQDVDSLKSNKNVTVTTGPGGEIRYIAFNFKTQPFGTGQTDADPAKALAVRQAVADLVDRDALSKLYKGTYTPLYSYVPDGLTGANTALKGLYGDGNGGPDKDKAAATLKAAGITSPVKLDITYNSDHYGPQSGDEYGLIKDQLASSGLFDVTVAGVENVQFSKDAPNDGYPVFQRGWFPDYADADNYLTPFFPQGGFLHNHYDNPQVDALITKELGDTDKDSRAKTIGDIQDLVAKDVDTVPLLQGTQVVVTGKDVKGAVLDASFKFRYATLSK
ncbi:ABC transporter substrate-binding protein [Gryllotalpicola protaetiae]|uniref:Peptide ABC transporter substrate-binding protein n=1 Tax=Gryllotalpicola protaetiae TaxID=2419771 RepID=A0A387BSL6_9MICO|nr:ABC transporter substrate-binding protein [Gryllotalpicola protaetiae]AYG05064.1 peptide ABC transporter substrate-binding protein [Gryllotalpicola protaetiae]